jgi:ABC-type tungstate transport system substrate-binding protein
MKKVSKVLMALMLAVVTFNAGRFILALFQDVSSFPHLVSTCVVSLFILVLLYSAGLLMFAKDGK